MSISDPSHLTCVGNDHGFEQVFARYRASARKAGDVLLAISTSGNSPTCCALRKSPEKKGVIVIGLTGKDGGKLLPL